MATTNKFPDLIRYNPFRPGSLIMPGMFAGRGGELIALERVLHQTKNGNPSHFIVTGERGIGKSSLFLFLASVAEGRWSSLTGISFKYVVVRTDLEKDFTQNDILQRLGRDLNGEIARVFKLSSLAKGAWDFLSKWEVMGVKYERADELGYRPYELLDELVTVIERTSQKLREEGYDGILFLVDEADKPSAQAHLGQITKNITEKLSKLMIGNVAFGLAGLPEVYSALAESHPSAPRIFLPIELNVLKPNERIDVIKKGLADAATKGTIVSIDDDAAGKIADLSEGYPNFIQQFAFCAFEMSRGDKIDLLDVEMGTEGPDGAIAQLGKKYFADLFFDQISSDDYRKVLSVMAEFGDDYVTKKEIKQKSGLKESTLTNAISVLKDKGIIRPKKGVMGVYRLPTKSFAVWIRSLGGKPASDLGLAM